jgi:TetR/AcrR family acrAB operon transcriptional repressor
MVKKTKEDAEKTRESIIDAARTVFLQRGVSRSSLEQIASKAGVTRGAVYWHFQNKTELMLALRERVFLPLIDQMEDTISLEENLDPLGSIEEFMCSRFEHLESCQETRETYEIMMTKCEYVDEFANVLQQITSNCSIIEDKLTTCYEQAQAKDQVTTKMTARELAMDSNLFWIGLLHLWIKDANGLNAKQYAIDAIKNHIKLRGK